MPDKEKPEEPEYLTPKEVREWAAQEVKDSTKAFELRVREANALVAAYSSAEISALEAENRLHQYNRRWGEALFGVYAAEGMSDQTILDQIDKARAEQETSVRGHVGRHVKRTPPETAR